RLVAPGVAASFETYRDSGPLTRVCARPTVCPGFSRGTCGKRRKPNPARIGARGQNACCAFYKSASRTEKRIGPRSYTDRGRSFSEALQLASPPVSVQTGAGGRFNG